MSEEFGDLLELSPAVERVSGGRVKEWLTILRSMPACSARFLTMRRIISGEILFPRERSEKETKIGSRSGDLLLELTDRLERLQIPSAVRAGTRQGHPNDLVDLPRRSSVGMKTVVRTCFPAGRFGVELGSSLGKGRGLPLLGPVGLLELAEDLRELTFEVGDASFEFRDLAVAWVVGRMFPRCQPL
jgi:hypothetical protein